MFVRAWVLSFCAISLLVVGCGGSSSSSSNFNSGGNNGSTTTTGQAQGVYSGTTSLNYTFSSIVLPNDKFYAIYGTVSNNTLLLYGMVTGQGKSDAGTYTANVTDFFYTGVTFSGSIDASYVPGSSFDGTYTEPGTSETYTGTALPASDFDYNTPASVSDITGTWNGGLLDGSSATVTITSSGSVSGSDSGCSFSGTVTADNSNKNFFDVSLTFGGSPCLLPNQTATGVGVEYLLSDNVTHQLIAAVNVATTAGTVFFATR